MLICMCAAAVYRQKSSNDCKSIEEGNIEACSLDVREAGTYQVLIYGYKAYQGDFARHSQWARLEPDTDLHTIAMKTSSIFRIKVKRALAVRLMLSARAMPV